MSEGGGNHETDLAHPFGTLPDAPSSRFLIDPAYAFGLRNPAFDRFSAITAAEGPPGPAKGLAKLMTVASSPFGRPMGAFIQSAMNAVEPSCSGRCMLSALLKFGLDF